MAPLVSLVSLPLWSSSSDSEGIQRKPPKKDLWLWSCRQTALRLFAEYLERNVFVWSDVLVPVAANLLFCLRHFSWTCFFRLRIFFLRIQLVLFCVFFRCSRFCCFLDHFGMLPLFWCVLYSFPALTWKASIRSKLELAWLLSSFSPYFFRAHELHKTSGSNCFGSPWAQGLRTGSLKTQLFQQRQVRLCASHLLNMYKCICNVETGRRVRNQQRTTNVIPPTHPPHPWWQLIHLNSS